MTDEEVDDNEWEETALVVALSDWPRLIEEAGVLGAFGPQLLVVGLGMPSSEMIAPTRVGRKTDKSDKCGISDGTSSLASDSSAMYSFFRMSLFPMYVSEVKERCSESGRFRKVT